MGSACQEWCERAGMQKSALKSEGSAGVPGRDLAYPLPLNIDPLPASTGTPLGEEGACVGPGSANGATCLPEVIMGGSLSTASVCGTPLHQTREMADLKGPAARAGPCGGR